MQLFDNDFTALFVVVSVRYNIIYLHAFESRTKNAVTIIDDDGVAMVKGKPKLNSSVNIPTHSSN